jgi:hypothetical protein
VLKRFQVEACLYDPAVLSGKTGKGAVIGIQTFMR